MWTVWGIRPSTPMTRQNLVRVIDALGNKTEIRYGEKNQPTHISINGKEKLKGAYDGDAKLTAMTDALGNQTQIQYNHSGWPKTIIPAAGRKPSSSRTGAR